MLTERQKQILAGSLLLAFGVAAGVVIAPDDPERNDKLADLATTDGSAKPPVGASIDTAEYHRTIVSVRADHPDTVDVLTAEVAPGAIVATEVSVAAGLEPLDFELVGPAVGRFSIACEDCGLSFDEGKDSTTVRLRAQNMSADPVRLTALISLGAP
jgi:hypothetical protein